MCDLVACQDLLGLPSNVPDFVPWKLKFRVHWIYMYWKAQEVYVFWAPAGTLNPGSREVSLPWRDFSRLFRTLPWSTSGLYAWSFSRPFPSGKEVSWTDMLDYSLDFSCLIHLLAPQSNHPSYPSWFFKFKISLWPTPWGPGTCWKWSHLSLTWLPPACEITLFRSVCSICLKRLWLFRWELGTCRSVSLQWVNHPFCMVTLDCHQDPVTVVYFPQLYLNRLSLPGSPFSLQYFLTCQLHWAVARVTMVELCFKGYTNCISLNTVMLLIVTVVYSGSTMAWLVLLRSLWEIFISSSTMNLVSELMLCRYGYPKLAPWYNIASASVRSTVGLLSLRAAIVKRLGFASIWGFIHVAELLFSLIRRLRDELIPVVELSPV